MSKFLKNYKCEIVIVLSFTLLLIWSIFNICNAMNSINISKENWYKNQELCKQNTNEIPKEYCNLILKNDEYPVSFYSTFYEIGKYQFGRLLTLLPLFILIPGLLFQKQEKKLSKKAYLSTIIVPIVYGIILVYCGIVSNDFTDTIWNFKNPWLFSVVYLLNLFIHSLLFLNIGVSISKKIKNYFLTVIASCVGIFLIEAILEILVNGFFSIILHLNYTSMFTIMNMITFNTSINVIAPFIVPTILMILFGILVHYQYKTTNS